MTFYPTVSELQVELCSFIVLNSMLRIEITTIFFNLFSIPLREVQSFFVISHRILPILIPDFTKFVRFLADVYKLINGLESLHFQTLFAKCCECKI